MKHRDLARWEPPTLVATWPCRNASCAVPVEITQDTVDNLAMFNRVLAERDERPIPESAVMLCDACAARRREKLVESAQRLRERTAEPIRELKASPTPRQEHRAIRELSQLGHPDVTGLLAALEEKLVGKPFPVRRPSNREEP